MENLQRSETAVLVVEAQTLGALAVIRSLGRAGYKVHACSYDKDAFGLKSNFVARAVVSPRYGSKDFIDWFRSYLRAENIKVVIPSESLLLALRPYFEEFKNFLPLVPDSSKVYSALSKCDTFKKLQDSGNLSHLPKSILLEGDFIVPSKESLAAIGYPLFIKVDGCYSNSASGGVVIKAKNYDEVLAVIAQQKEKYAKMLIQGFVSGIGVGVFFLVWKGEVVAEFMHRRLHEVPHTGGASSLRESFWHSGIRDDAFAKLQALKWEGVCMFEYRLDPLSGQFHFIELNSRFWGSLHLALFSGIDFPLLLLETFLAKNPKPQTTFPLGVRARVTFPSEVSYVWTRLKDRDLSLLQKLWSIVEFFFLGLNPQVHSDYNFPADRKLYLLSLKRFITKLS